MSQTGKSRFREQAINALLSESSIEDAALKAGISKRTLLRWLKEPDFREQYAKAKENLLKLATAILARNATKAAKTLEAIFTAQPTAHQGPRVMAARATLEVALGAWTLEQFEARLAALENQSTDDKTV